MIQANVNKAPGHEQFSELLTLGKNWYSAKEAGAIVGRSAQYIRDLFDNQKILGHQANGRAGKGSEKRMSYQVHRDCMLLYLMETANYEPDDFLDRLGEVLRNRPPEQLESIQKLVNETIQNKSRLKFWQ